MKGDRERDAEEDVLSFIQSRSYHCCQNEEGLGSGAEYSGITRSNILSDCLYIKKYIPVGSVGEFHQRLNRIKELVSNSNTPYVIISMG